MTRSTSLGLLFAACFATACSGVDDPSLDGDGTNDDDGGLHVPPPQETPIQGTSCTYRHGEHTLQSWAGEDDATYQAASFSFEVASNEIDITRNDVDVLLQRNLLQVNTVTDDRSFIVDLGAVPLADVPQSVDPSGYPTGYWGEHDSIDAVAGHTYVVRTEDGNTRQWAAFRVVTITANRAVTIEWIRSPDPERLHIPVDCL